MSGERRRRAWLEVTFCLLVSRVAFTDSKMIEQVLCVER